MRMSKSGPAELIRRALILVAVSSLLAALVAAPVSAVSVRRTWTAPLGGNGVNGTAILKAFMTGGGSLELTLVGLQPSTTYPVIAYVGSCVTPKVVTRLPGAVTDATGAVSKVSAVSIRIMNSIWAYGRTGTIAIKVGNGAMGRCGTLTYPV